MTHLYHASSWEALASLNKDDTFTLIPGSQCAEGQGVYFSEGAERVSASDSVYSSGTHSATVVLEVCCATGWWRSKKSALKKKGRTRTWHSSSKSIECRVARREGHLLYCEWSFK